MTKQEHELITKAVEEISDSLSQIASSIDRLSNTLFDTLGSYKAGKALDGMAELPNAINDLCDLIRQRNDEEEA